MNTPGDLTGSHDLVAWLNALKRACQANELKSGVGYRVRRTPQGTVLETIGDGRGGSSSGTVIYMKACLEDGTECYVPVLVQGTIYRVPTGSPTVPTIDSGTVPSGSNQLV